MVSNAGLSSKLSQDLTGHTDRNKQQAISDKVLGMAMLGVAAFVFTYYTFWALLTVVIGQPSALKYLECAKRHCRPSLSSPHHPRFRTFSHQGNMP
jgi:hypothetical protein